MECLNQNGYLKSLLKIKFKKIYNRKPSEQIARDNIKLGDKQLNKELAKKITIPYYFTDRALQVGLNITRESHHFNQANFKKILKPNYPEFGIENRYITKIIKKLSVTYARLIKQYKLKYRTIFSARFDKQDEDNQVLDEAELFSNSNISHILRETDLDNIDNKSHLEHQIQEQEVKDSGWRFENINSMAIYFYKTGEMNGRFYVEFPLRSSAILNNEKDVKIVSYGQY